MPKSKCLEESGQGLVGLWALAQQAAFLTEPLQNKHQQSTIQGCAHQAAHGSVLI